MACPLVKGSQRSGNGRRRRQRPAVVPQPLFDVALMLDGAVGFAEERRMDLFAGRDEEQDTCSGVARRITIRSSPRANDLYHPPSGNIGASGSAADDDAVNSS